jgi:hypothetical protein
MGNVGSWQKAGCGVVSVVSADTLTAYTDNTTVNALPAFHVTHITRKSKCYHLVAMKLVQLGHWEWDAAHVLYNCCTMVAYTSLTHMKGWSRMYMLLDLLT